MIGMRVEHSVSGVYMRYFQKDHLNSIAVLTDETGSVVEQLSYDAWGKRRHAANGADDPADSIASQTNRCFAGHDQRTVSTYIFGTVCPQEGKAATLVLPTPKR